MLVLSFQWAMDFLICNGLGIYLGMKTCEYLSMKVSCDGVALCMCEEGLYVCVCVCVWCACVCVCMRRGCECVVCVCVCVCV